MKEAETQRCREFKGRALAVSLVFLCAAQVLIGTKAEAGRIPALIPMPQAVTEKDGVFTVPERESPVIARTAVPTNEVPPEAFSFGLARKLLAHYEGTPLHLDMRSVLDKIAESLEGEITIEPDWLSEHVGVLPEDRVRIDPEVWAKLASCVERCEAVRATYQTFDGRVSEYKLHPYHLLAYHGNWYVLARNVGKDRVETFALSRFRRLEATGQNFTRSAEFNPETYARQAFGILGGEKPIRVRLLFEPKLAVYITERQWHPSQEFRTRADGCVEMRMETTGRKELVRWVLSWMPDVKVLAPKSLRDRIVDKLRDGLRAQQ